MTDDRIALFEPVRKSDSREFLKSLLEHTLNRLMAFEVDAACGAEQHERGDGRPNWRNGYRDPPASP